MFMLNVRYFLFAIVGHHLLKHALNAFVDLPV